MSYQWVVKDVKNDGVNDFKGLRFFQHSSHSDWLVQVSYHSHLFPSSVVYLTTTLTDTLPSITGGNENDNIVVNQ